MSFYILESIYTGSKEYCADLDHVVIIKGSCDGLEDYTCNDWSLRYHGTFDTVESAEKRLKETFDDDLRDCDSEDENVIVRNVYFGFEDDNVVAMYKTAKLSQMSISASGDFVYDFLKDDVDVDTTDEDIDKLVSKYELEANDQGLELLGDVEQWIKNYRQELININEK